MLCFFSPIVTKRSGPAVTACYGLAITALAMIFAAAGFSLVLASVILSAGVALAVPGLIAGVTFWSGKQVRARALSIYTFFLFIGASAGPILASLLYQLDTAIAFGTPAAAALLAAGILYLTRPNHSRLINNPKSNQH